MAKLVHGGIVDRKHRLEYDMVAFLDRKLEFNEVEVGWLT
jgi:hypothetical protein